MASAREVVVKILGDNTSLKKSLNQSQGDLNSFQAGVQSKFKGLDVMGGIGQSVGAAVAGYASVAVAAGAAFSFIKSATSAAMEDMQQQKVLANSLRDTVNATDETVAANERWITSVQNATGVSDEMIRSALVPLVSTTKDLAQSQDLVSVAMDISTARGLSLEAVSVALAKASQGNVAALGRLGIAYKDSEGNVLSFDEVVKNANETFGGATAAAADTVAGKLQILNVKFQDLKEEIGMQLMPVLGNLADQLNNSVIPAWSALAGVTGAASSKLDEYRNKAVGFATSVPGMLKDAFSRITGIGQSAAGGGISMAPARSANAAEGPLRANSRGRTTDEALLQSTIGLQAGMKLTDTKRAWFDALLAQQESDRGKLAAGASKANSDAEKAAKEAERLLEERRKADEEAVAKTLKIWADAREHQRDLEDNAFADGQLALDKYTALLNERLTQEEKFSDDWSEEKRKLTKILKDQDDQRVKDAKDAADKQREIAEDLLDDLNEMRERQDNMFEVGAIGNDEYIAILQGRLAEFEQYSDEWTSVYKELQSLGAIPGSGGGGGGGTSNSTNMVTSSMGSAFNISNVNVTANNADELVKSLNDYARRNGGLRVPGGVTAVS